VATCCLQEFRLFLTLEGELESSPQWTSVAPPPSANLMESTALLSKQLLGLEKSVLDPVQVSKGERIGEQRAQKIVSRSM
jgi:hypothetical protein